MGRFLRGLNGDIADIVELQPYTSLEQLVHLAIKVEQQKNRSKRYSSNVNKFSTTRTPTNVTRP